MKYYVRDTKGRVAGPFSEEALKKAAREGRILPSWHLSSTQEKWTLAAKVPDLFPAAEISQSVESPAVDQPRSSTREDQIAIFVDTFMGGKDRFRDAVLWIQKVQFWWVNLTRPSNGFIITEVGPKGFTRLRYDFAREQPADISEDEFEKAVKAGIRRVDWYAGFAFVVILVGCIWTIPDFASQSDLMSGIVKLVAFLSLLVFGYIYKIKRSKVFIGYSLTLEAKAKQNQLVHAFDTLSSCARISALRVGTTDKHWKYSIGSTTQIARLPVPNFRQPLPNIVTNVGIRSLAFDQFAIYFLPEKLLVIDGKNVRHIDYRHLDISKDDIEYTEISGHVYRDSLIVHQTWLHSRINGLPDMRYKKNHRIPTVRCGILNFNVPGSPVSLITTDPSAPETFRRNLPVL